MKAQCLQAIIHQGILYKDSAVVELEKDLADRLAADGLVEIMEPAQGPAPEPEIIKPEPEPEPEAAKGNKKKSKID